MKNLQMELPLKDNNSLGVIILPLQLNQEITNTMARFILQFFNSQIKEVLHECFDRHQNH